MKTHQFSKYALLLLLLAIFNLRISTAFAQGTAFTYQGRLTENGSPATGHYDMLFSLFDAPTGGNQVDGTLMGTAVPVTNGLFAIQLDFGNGIFTGAARWLKIDVRTNASAAPYTPLTPRQALTATPYAVTAGQISGNLPANQVSGTLALSQLPGAVVTNNQSGVNLLGTFIGNGSSVSNVNAATLGGLGAANFWKTGGNSGTTAGTHFLGTTDNQPVEIKVNGQRAFRLEPNTNGAPNVVGGSAGNVAGPGVNSATITGGLSNRVEKADQSTISGGFDNLITSDIAFGFYANAIGGGEKNFLGRTRHATIGGGFVNTITNSFDGVISGGIHNAIVGSDSGAIGGGNGNTIESPESTISGGFENRIGTNSPNSVISGGGVNHIQNSGSSIIAAGVENFIKDSGSSTIAGGAGNVISNDCGVGTIAGGNINVILDSSSQAFIGGGVGNAIVYGSDLSTIGGGIYNSITYGVAATIAGGYINTIDTSCWYSAIGGGANNRIEPGSYSATIAGGGSNLIGTNSSNGAIGGGGENTIANNSSTATIPGGFQNTATNRAFAAGTRAKAIHSGSFVWGDSFEGNVSSSTNNEFTARASGGVRFFSNTNLTAGVSLAPGGTSWSVISDRNAKKDFVPVNSRAVLEKLSAIPITQWHYQWEDENNTPHIGPMAQDFKAAFYPGSDDTRITTQEADGVALAAIQGLNEVVKEKDVEIQELKQSVAELKQLIGTLAIGRNGGAK